VFGERSRRKRRRTDGDGDGGTDRDKVNRLEKKLSMLEARLETTTKLPSEREEESDPGTGAAHAFLEITTGRIDGRTCRLWLL